MNVKASVIVPAHGREDLIERAIQSVINSNGSKQVEIIIVDDCSAKPISLEQRDNLQIIRSDKKNGAAISRNIGIEAAQGDIIYLLDSDDYFVDVDFEVDHKRLLSQPGLYYKSLRSQNYSSNFPEQLSLTSYLDDIFWRYEHIAQTSSLCFNKTLGLRFDPSLPKHQDWDFVYSALSAGVQVKRGDGVVFFDRSDRNSLSRKYNSAISKPWYEKLSQAKLSAEQLEFCRFHLFCKYPQEYKMLSFLGQSLKYLISNKLRPVKFAKYFAHRLIQLKNQVRSTK